MEPPRTSREFHDTTALPFPERLRKPVADEQFDKFVEVIQKLSVKDILGNKGSLPTTEVVQLTDKCSAAILDGVVCKDVHEIYNHNSMR